MPTSEAHVVIFTFPFGSQPMPLLNLVLKLARAAPDVWFSYFNTVASNRWLNLSSKHLPSNIISYMVEDGLRPGVPDSKDPPGAPEVEAYLKEAPKNFRTAVEAAAAERGRDVTCLLADAVVSLCVAAVARELDVPWFPVWSPFPAALSAHVHTNFIRDKFGHGLHQHDEQTLEMIPGFSAIRVGDLVETVLLDRDSLFSRHLGQLGQVLPRAAAVVVCFVRELNPPSLTTDLNSMCPNVLHVGNTILSPASHLDLTGCLPWLDGRNPASVYISFGTSVTLPPGEIGELAEALELGNVPFLSSLRDNLRMFLPSGFVERTGVHGKIVPWAHQVQVLSHKSVGVFVTQGGCNSLTESISAGVPLICRPIFADQMMVARMVEEVWGIGRRVEGGVITKGGFLKTLQSILGDENGRTLRDKVEVTRELLVRASGPNYSATQDTKTLVGMIS